MKKNYAVSGVIFFISHEILVVKFFLTFRRSAGVLQKCNTSVTEVFRSVTGVVKECYSSVTHLSWKFLWSVTGVVKECYRSVTHLPQEVFRSVTGGVKEC